MMKLADYKVSHTEFNSRRWCGKSVSQGGWKWSVTRLILWRRHRDYLKGITLEGWTEYPKKAEESWRGYPADSSAEVEFSCKKQKGFW